MPEITIKYDKPETLKILKAFAKYFDFSVLPLKSNKKSAGTGNDVKIIPADTSIDTSGMEAIFSGKNIDAKELRKKACQRH